MVDTIMLLLVHISFLLGVGMIVMVLRESRPSQVRRAFNVTFGFMTVWNLGTLLEMDFRLAGNTAHASLFIDLCYIGICVIPIAILYLGRVILRPDWQPKVIHSLFLIVPVASIVIVFTNPLHHLFFVQFSLYSTEAVYGVYYYFHSLYSYACIAAGVILMIVASARSSGLFSMQSLLVIAGVVITVVPNVLYSYGIGDLQFSISTVTFTVSVLCFLVAFLKYGFTSTIPITLQQVVDLISDGYLVIDTRLRITTYNKTLLNMFPESGDITFGKTLSTFIENYFLNASYDLFLEFRRQAITQQRTVSFEKQILGGAYVSVELTPIMHRNVHLGCIILLKDITKSKQLIEATQAASRAKGEFLSRMSHEIRTPLGAVMGMISIGLNSKDADKKDYCLERANSASKHLLGIINDILDISKIEADKFELSFEEFDLEQMLINVTNVVSIRAEEKKQDFVANMGKELPQRIIADQLRLSQVITNLLSNAIKFTPEYGTVAINVEKTDELGDRVILRFEVADTGIGISEDQQKRLFTSFTQADAGIAYKFGGTGLGLAISKRIVELMNGNIWIESELGKGAKFIFTIRVKTAAKKPRRSLAPGIKKEDIRILAIDDSVEIRDYFLYVMDSLNLYCDVAEGGRQAIEKIKQKEDKPYNIFFVDWQMPGMNGIEVTKKIKEINGENSVVIMISVSEWNEIENEALAAGVKQFIPKPLFPSTLIDAINDCISIESNAGKSGLQDAEPKRVFDFSGHTLLIAEDVEINREIMSAILEYSNVSIDFAENGKIAVSMFSENPDKYSLILMDIQMPEMDGYKATRALRSLDLARAKEIPIIAMTANVFREDIEKCFEAGMNAHTGKPVDSDALFDILQKYLG